MGKWVRGSGDSSGSASGSDDTRWEEECYDHGCRSAREEAVRRLRVMDERLLHERPQGWKVQRSCRRMFLTRFGKITVTKRLYLDEKGLDWRKKVEAMAQESHSKSRQLTFSQNTKQPHFFLQ